MITYKDGNIIVDFKSNGISGTHGVNVYRLHFQFSYSTYVRPDKHYEFKNAKAEVYIEIPNQGKLFLSYADPEKPLFIVSDSNVNNGDIVFIANFTSQQLDSIEDFRRGGDLRLKLLILGEAIGKDGSSSARDELTIIINQKAWIDALKQMRFCEFLLFEIPIPPEGASQETKSVIDSVIKAKSHFMYGNYREVVSTCRMAIESLSIIYNDNSQIEIALRLFNNKKREMSKEQREILIREAIRNFTHLALHPSEEEQNKGQVVSFNRNDAGFILGMIATLVSFLFKNDAEKSKPLDTKKD